MNRELVDLEMGAHYSDRMREVVYWLRLNPGHHTVPEIAQGLGLDERATRNLYMYVRRLTYAGWLANDFRGAYRAARRSVHPMPDAALGPVRRRA